MCFWDVCGRVAWLCGGVLCVSFVFVFCAVFVVRERYVWTAVTVVTRDVKKVRFCGTHPVLSILVLGLGLRVGGRGRLVVRA